MSLKKKEKKKWKNMRIFRVLEVSRGGHHGQLRVVARLTQSLL